MTSQDSSIAVRGLSSKCSFAAAKSETHSSNHQPRLLCCSCSGILQNQGRKFLQAKNGEEACGCGIVVLIKFCTVMATNSPVISATPCRNCVIDDSTTVLKHD